MSGVAWILFVVDFRVNKQTRVCKHSGIHCVESVPSLLIPLLPFFLWYIVPVVSIMHGAVWVGSAMWAQHMVCP